MTRIVGVGLVLAVVLVYFRQRYEELAVQLSAVFVILVLLFLIVPLRQMVDLFSQLADQAGMNRSYLGIVLKSMGVAYLAAFGGQISRDAGEEAIAVAIELAGKVFIILLALPVIVAILDTLVQLLPT